MQKVKDIFSNKDSDRAMESSMRQDNNLTGNPVVSGSHNSGSQPLSSDSPNYGSTEGHNSSTGLRGASSGYNADNNIGVGEKGLGRDPVAGSTGHGTMSHGTDNRSSVGGAGAGAAAASALSGDNTNRNSTSSNTGSAGERITSKLTGGHTFGHDNRTDSKFDPTGSNTQHDHKHLNAVTHQTVRHQEVEEVERVREHQKNVHHLQHHVQPVRDQQIKDEVHHTNQVPVTHINERHANTEEDVKLFQSLGEKHRDEERHMPKERTVVDLGERVNEVTHHHVHHVTQPVIEREVVDKHRIHTTIPLTHTTHEAPIIHKSSVHEPVHMSDFLKGGGKLDSGITHSNTGILSTGECDRSVDGVGEKLARELNLKDSSFGRSGTTGSTGLTGNTGSTNLTSGTGSHGLSGNQGATGNHGVSSGTGSNNPLSSLNNNASTTGNNNPLSINSTRTTSI